MQRTGTACRFGFEFCPTLPQTFLPPTVWPPPRAPPRDDLRSHSSMAQRADLLELDCQLTQNGVVVVSHDGNLWRQSGVDSDVSSLDFEVSFVPAPHCTQRSSICASWSHASCSPQELPLYKEELEVYFSPGKPMGCKPWTGPTQVG